MASTIPKLMTADELLMQPDDDQRYDLIEGMLYSMSPTGGVHGEIGGDILGYLHAYVTPRRLGRVYGAETGFRLARDPDTVLGPDVAFVRAERLPARRERDTFLPLAPDLAVEIVSPGDRLTAVGKKVQAYLRAGVPLVWVIHPRRLTVTEYRPGQPERVYRPTDTLEGGDIIPGFQLPLGPILQPDDEKDVLG